MTRRGGGADEASPAPGAPEGTPLAIEQVVRWGDQDALGHVNNTVLFQYCESARIAFFDAIGLERFRTRPALGPGLVAAELSFKRQVRYPGVVRVEVFPTALGARSFTLAYRLVDGAGGEVVAEGSSVCVWVDYDAGRALLLDDPLRRAIAAAPGSRIPSREAASQALPGEE